MRTITRDIVGALIFSSDNKLLIGQTALGAGGVYSGTWVIPGGGVKRGETKLEALQREIMEETAVDINGYSARLLDDTATGTSQKTLRTTGERVMVNMNFNDYELRLEQPAVACGAQPSDELVKLQWVAMDDLPNTNLSPPTIKLLKKQGYLK